MNGVDIVILDYRFCKLSFICVKKYFLLLVEKEYTRTI